MQGLVTLDFGNSHPHAGLFQKTSGQWQLLKTVPWIELDLYLSQLGMTPDNTSIVLCEVRAREEELLPHLQKGFLLTRVKEYWRGKRFAGMPVHYSHTLGEDRLILAYHQFKKEKTPTLIIDAGTFVTIDLVTEDGFQGGYIIPGIRNYFSCFQSGEQLKDKKLRLDVNNGLPQESASAMSQGYFAFCSLAQSLIKKHHVQKVILTGGDSLVWEKIFHEQGLNVNVQLEPHLIHFALQYWMTTQIEPL